ncbi:hypothetical protein Z968_13210 [Clostridium novyi A str. 4552]|uniref:6-hydroxymethylpterin diphosphokinase MptE-like domain-containing protein n=1 Tax=Clostridium novyi A str. 4552 TaxID=1444289 RepID=A0A0A0HW50_CLONO|nr:6-hydroxymethylpterin diphosphokinase MptE-like protein [Clostridium novyi]KGM92777.1 hypothetical protein Z968_13210 [Clostridium novyi A str. 4552]
MIKFEKSKQGVLTLKYDNKYIHSKYDPIKESSILIDKYENLVKKSVVVVYGIGLGYHIDEILLRNPKAKIYVFDGNKELINVCKKENHVLFENYNIKIISKENKKFYSIFRYVIDKVEDIIVHKPSLETIKYSDYELYSVINNYIISKESVDESGLLKENYIQNLNIKYKNIKNLINKFLNENKTFVITAAGPSLDDELKILRENKEKFIIITVGTALNALMNNDIRPDIVVIIDGKEVVAKQLDGFKNEQIPLCFLSTASRWAVKEYNGPKYIFFNSKDEDEIVIETGKTVAVAAMSIAIQCGAKKIVLLGQDLAYLNGKSHTNTYETIYGCKDNPTINKYNKFVKGIYGYKLETTSGYIFFKEQIERIIDINKDVKFINCSKGAFIKGATHMEFKNYIKNSMNQNC